MLSHYTIWFHTNYDAQNTSCVTIKSHTLKKATTKAKNAIREMRRTGCITLERWECENRHGKTSGYFQSHVSVGGVKLKTKP